MTGGGADSQLHVRTTQWITVNYILLVIWVFVWMVDQARVRGKNVWVWLLPYIICPLPTLAAFILFLQRRKFLTNHHTRSGKAIGFVDRGLDGKESNHQRSEPSH